MRRHDAIGAAGSINQFNTWNWTLDCSSLVATTEVTLRRAERTADPATPAFSVTVPITGVSQQGLKLSGTVPPGLNNFSVTFFSVHSTVGPTSPIRHGYCRRRQHRPRMFGR